MAPARPGTAREGRVLAARRLSAVHVAALVRVFLVAGWSVSDLAYALDHAPDGAAHWHTAPVHSTAAAKHAQRREQLADIRANLAERRRPARAGRGVGWPGLAEPDGPGSPSRQGRLRDGLRPPWTAHPRPVPGPTNPAEKPPGDPKGGTPQCRQPNTDPERARSSPPPASPASRDPN